MDPELLRLLNELAETFKQVSTQIQQYAVRDLTDPFSPSYNEDGTLTNPTKSSNLTTSEKTRWVQVASIFSKELGFEKDMFRFPEKVKLSDDPLKVIITGIQLDARSKQLLKGQKDEGSAISNLLKGVTGTIGGVGGAIGGGGFIGTLATIGTVTAGALGAVTAISAGIFGIGKAIEHIDTDKFLKFVGGLADVMGGKLRDTLDYLFLNKDNLIEIFQKTLLPVLKEYMGLVDNQLGRVFNVIIKAGGGAKDIIIEIIDTIEKVGIVALQQFGSVLNTALFTAKSVLTDPVFIEGLKTTGFIIGKVVVDSLTRFAEAFEYAVNTVSKVLNNDNFNRTLRFYIASLSHKSQLLFGEKGVLQSLINNLPTIFDKVTNLIATPVSNIIRLIDSISTAAVITFKNISKEAQELANIDSAELFKTAAGLVAIANAITFKSIGSTFESVTGMFSKLTGSKGPVSVLREIGNTSPLVQATANALERVYGLMTDISKTNISLTGFNINQIKDQIDKIKGQIESKLKITVETPLQVDMKLDDVTNIIKKTSRVKTQLMDNQVELLKKNNELLQIIMELLATDKSSSNAVALMGGSTQNNLWSTKNSIRRLVS